MLALFTLTTIVWFFPLLLQLNSSVLVGPNDETYAVREYWGAEQDGKTPFTWQHDYLNAAPEGFPFAPAVQIANFVQPGFVWVLRDVLGLYGAFNLFLLLGFVLTGFMVYLLLDRIGIGVLPGVFAGYAVAFNPWMIERAFAGHAGYMHAWIFPALVLVLLSAHRRRLLWSAAIVGLVLALSFYISSYYGLLAALLVGVFWVVDFVLARGLAEKLWTTTLVCVMTGVTGAALAPAALAWVLDRDRVAASVSNDVQQLQNLGASAESYILPSTRHPVLGGITRSFDVLADQHWAENTLYVGYSTLILGLIAIGLIVRRHPRLNETTGRRIVLLFAAVLVPAAFLFSLKRYTSILGIDVPMPAYVMGQFTTFWRVYARFGVLVVFGLALLAAFTLHVARERRGGRALGAVALAVLVFEFLPGTVPVFATDQPEPYARWLATQPRGIVANYPLATDSSEALNLLARAFYQQMYYRQPNYAAFGSGYSGTREEGIRILSRYLDDPNTPGILAAEDVRYVLVHDDVYREQGVEPPPVPAGFELVRTLPGNVRVLALQPTVAPVDLDALLEQQAVSIAAVQGLPTPPLSFGAGFSDPVTRDGEEGWRIVEDGAELRFENDDPRLRRLQLVIRVRSLGGAQVLRVLHPDGTIAGQASVGPGVSQVVIGPFATGLGTSQLTFRIEPAGQIELAPPLVQPVASFPVSLRPEGDRR